MFVRLLEHYLLGASKILFLYHLIAAVDVSKFSGGTSEELLIWNVCCTYRHLGCYVMHYLKCFLERSVEGDLSSPVIFAAKLTPNANISERLEAGMPSLMIMFFPKLSLFTFRKSIIEVIVGPGVRQTPFCGSQPQENLLFCLHFLIQPRLRRWRTFC